MATPTLATYGGATLTPGFPGGVAETGPNVVRSFMNESATAIDLGAVVVRGTATGAGVTDKCKPVAAGTDVPIGISVRNAGTLIASSANVINYVQYTAVPVMTFGVVYCTAAEAVTEGDAVVVVVATPTTVGGVTGGAGNGTTRLAFPNAIWLDTTASAAVGRVRVNMTTT